MQNTRMLKHVYAPYFIHKIPRSQATLQLLAIYCSWWPYWMSNIANPFFILLYTLWALKSTQCLFLYILCWNKWKRWEY